MSARRRLQNRVAQQRFRGESCCRRLMHSLAKNVQRTSVSHLVAEKQRHKASATPEQTEQSSAAVFNQLNTTMGEDVYAPPETEFSPDPEWTVSSPLGLDNAPVQWHIPSPESITACPQTQHISDSSLGSGTSPSSSLPEVPYKQSRQPYLQQMSAFPTESNDCAVIQPQGILPINTPSSASASPLDRSCVRSYSSRGNSSASSTSSMEQLYTLSPPSASYYETPPQKDPLLHVAVRTQKKSMVRLLLHRGASWINEQDINGRTALHVAAQTGDDEMVETLLQHGADPKALDGDGLDSLRCAVERGHEVVAEKLLEAMSWNLD